MMKKNFVFVTVILITLAACDHLTNNQDDNDYICENRNNRKKRPCTASEVKFIHKFNSMVQKIEAFHIDDLEEKYITHQHGSAKLTNIYLLGEAHIDIEGILNNWGFIRHLTKNATQQVNVLIEGMSSFLEGDNNKFSLIQKVYIETYLTQLFVDKGLIYTPERFDKFSEKNLEIAWNNFFTTLKNLKMHPFAKALRFSYWDAPGEGFFTRNKSMIKAIDDKLASDPKVPIVVIAGSEHLPLGEKRAVKKREPALMVPHSFKNYYPFIKRIKQKRKRDGKLNWQEKRFGLTQVIYDYLTNNGLDVLEAIPKSSLKYL